IPPGPKEYVTYEQTMFPPGTSCIYRYADGSSIVVSYPLLTAQWFYLLVLVVVASGPWLFWWIKFRARSR
ncbi:MAG: hypothetical protein WD178_11870, partial [Actinomycetota bacterium]